MKIQFDYVSNSGEASQQIIDIDIDKSIDPIVYLDQLDKHEIMMSYDMDQIIQYRVYTPAPPKDKKRKIKTVLYLEGSSSLDRDYAVANLAWQGFFVTALCDLYDKPELLKKIPEIDPDYIFIDSTGTYRDKASNLSSEFAKLNYIPRNIIFIDEMAFNAYSDISRRLQRSGTKLFFMGIRNLREIK